MADMDIITDVLKKLKLEDLQTKFADQGITDDLISDLAIDDLKEVIPRLGDRIKFFKQFKATVSSSAKIDDQMGTKETILCEKEPPKENECGSTIDALCGLGGVQSAQPETKKFAPLGQMKGKIDDLNILILGETGVGKSTWINSFVNFLQFEGFEDAEKGELCTLVHTKFTVCDSDFKEITVSTGTDPNEIHTTGNSATQLSQIYPFDINGVTVRIIDTPGIGDTRGIEQDKKNFQNILHTLSYLKELNGICILLKPNNSRLTVMFRFCIKELLTYLHRDASKNIMFCFTNSRGTFYRPGDTLPALRKLLLENMEVEIPINANTVYCYDSEAYRFLAAVKNKNNPVKFTADERNNFVQSWYKSSAETKRMLNQIAQLKPHPIQNTLNLNNARELVVKLTGPLAEISKTIQTTKEVVKDQMEDITNHAATIQDLEDRKLYDRPELDIIEIDYPRTVCTNTNCKRYYGPKECKQTEYISICHDHCKLDGVAHNTVGDPELINCLAMDRTTNCKHCRHNYLEHMHIYFETRQVTKQVEDESIKQLLQQNLSVAETKKRILAAKQKEVNELDYELKEIAKASVKFACFLKNNAITPYNDAMLEYLEHLIREEKGKIAAGGTDKVLGSLQSHKASYSKEVQILDHEMNIAGSTNALTPQEIQDLVNHLYNLKHNGKKLKKSLSMINQLTQKVGATKQHVMMQPKPQKKGSGTTLINWFQDVQDRYYKAISTCE